jgi:hypothetical protein
MFEDFQTEKWKELIADHKMQIAQRQADQANFNAFTSKANLKELAQDVERRK